MDILHRDIRVLCKIIRQRISKVHIRIYKQNLSSSIISQGYSPEKREVSEKRNYLIQKAIKENEELKKKYIKDFKLENSMKKVGYKLLKNTDVETMNVLMSTYKQIGAPRSNRVAINSHDLKYSFQDYELKDTQNYTRIIKIPQREHEVQDTLNGQLKIYKPPDIVVEQPSQYRENYFQLLANQTKPFNKRKCDITKEIKPVISKEVARELSSQGSKELSKINLLNNFNKGSQMMTSSFNLQSQKSKSIGNSHQLRDSTTNYQQTSQDKRSNLNGTFKLEPKLQDIQMPTTSNPNMRNSLIVKDSYSLKTSVVNRESLPMIKQTLLSSQTRRGSQPDKDLDIFASQETENNDNEVSISTKRYQELCIKKRLGGNDKSYDELKKFLSPSKYINYLVQLIRKLVSGRSNGKIPMDAIGGLIDLILE
ncbi:UNKNOWN [Stylonychia lemnae]|uniref:Uncharacterized protein n=1 Tax=Stylonychia lemnae TaxID=5949 RepID=A0A078B687_STYLE|nr:UNKNOWN [Stylonychia lemnae]|eukprot:CDW90040.1 UNKNOWN [Stylonychia lemnae]